MPSIPFRFAPARTRRRIARLQLALHGPSAIQLPVQRTALRSLLSAEEFATYVMEYEWSYPTPTRAERQVLDRYAKEVRAADSSNRRAMKLPKVGLRALARDQLSRKASRGYGDAFELLQGLLEDNPSLIYLFDQPLPDSGDAEEPDRMPRLVCTLLSHHGLRFSGQDFAHIANMQRNAIRCSLARLIGPIATAEG